MTDRVNDNLLLTIQSDVALSAQLDQMDADGATISVNTASGTPLFSHPKITASPFNDPDQSETLELSAPIGVTPSSLPAEGFVPRRRVAAFGDKQHGDAEYRLVGRLGSGGTGVVYQAHQRAIDREVAVKVLRDNLAGDPQSRERFLTEARVIGALDHPNVIALHELCVDDKGDLFYSMKRVDGTSWDERIIEMTDRDNLATLMRVAEAIRYAHSRGIIHRDLKPENVMLGRFGEVLLADWGLAVNKRITTDSLTNSTIGGTPAYMAPELAAGVPNDVGFHTDVYLLGATLFHLLTGHPPHHGNSLLDCIRNAAANVIVPTRVEGELMDIALRAMKTRPEDRYASVNDFIAALADEQIHRQSTRLVTRAREALVSDPGTLAAGRQYEGFRVADALLREAIEVWPENDRATQELQHMQSAFAHNAAQQGDLDLALALYDAAGESESEAANRTREMIREREERNKREAKFTAFFTDSPEAGLLTHMGTGQIVEANIAFSELLGYGQDEVVNRMMGELNVWKCPERRVSFVNQLKQTGRIENFLAVFEHKDGHAIDVLISARETNVGDTQMLVSTIRDVTLRKRAEDELKRNRQRLADLQHLAGLGTWEYDIRTETISWSDETYRIVGRDPNLGPPTYEEHLASLHPDDRPALEAAVRGAIESGAAYELRIRHHLGGARYREVFARGQPILDENGTAVELYGVLIPTRRLTASGE